MSSPCWASAYWASAYLLGVNAPLAKAQPHGKSFFHPCTQCPNVSPCSHRFLGAIERLYGTPEPHPSWSPHSSRILGISYESYDVYDSGRLVNTPTGQGFGGGEHMLIRALLEGDGENGADTCHRACCACSRLLLL